MSKLWILIVAAIVAAPFFLVTADRETRESTDCECRLRNHDIKDNRGEYRFLEGGDDTAKGERADCGCQRRNEDEESSQYEYSRDGDCGCQKRYPGGKNHEKLHKKSLNKEQRRNREEVDQKNQEDSRIGEEIQRETRASECGCQRKHSGSSDHGKHHKRSSNNEHRRNRREVDQKTSHKDSRIGEELQREARASDCGCQRKHPGSDNHGKHHKRSLNKEPCKHRREVDQKVHEEKCSCKDKERVRDRENNNQMTSECQCNRNTDDKLDGNAGQCPYKPKDRASSKEKRQLRSDGESSRRDQRGSSE